MWHYNRRGRSLAANLRETRTMAKGYFIQVIFTAMDGFFVALTVAAGAAEPGGVGFRKAVLDTVFRSEGVAVGDFDMDGKKDIAAGMAWYQAPDWKIQLVGEKAPEFD